MTATPFKIYGRFRAFEKSDDPEKRMWIGGICSTGHLDKQDEEVVQAGLDFNPFLSDGWFNDNHGQRAADVLGYPTDAFYVTKGTVLPTGDQAEESGWYTEGYLLNTEEGRRIYAMAQSLEDSPRQLGFSIEGSVKERDRKNRKRILQAVVKNVAITHCPVNAKTRLSVKNLAKALVAGTAINSGDLNQGPGDGGALRVESLEGAHRPDRIYRKENGFGGVGYAPDGRHEDPEDPETEDLSDDDAEDVSKAEEFELEPITLDELFEEWRPALRKAQARMGNRLTKAEAEIVVRDRYPNLTDAEVDRIIDNAAGGSA